MPGSALDHIFFASDADLGRARVLAAQVGEGRCLILPLGTGSEAPDPASWKEAGIATLDLNRYWLNHLKSLMELAAKSLPSTPFLDPEVARSPHFLLSLAWHLGDDYLKYFDAICGLLEKHRPKSIRFDTPRGLNVQIIGAAAGKLGIPCLSLDGKARA